MGKKKKQRIDKRPQPVKATLEELSISRDGGQIALRGYSYQFLYSCYLILSSADQGTVFTLEGIEDIDTVKYKADGKHTTHIQLKYSAGKQDASFMDGVLKNYLEAYLIDTSRTFKHQSQTFHHRPWEKELLR